MGMYAKMAEKGSSQAKQGVAGTGQLIGALFGPDYENPAAAGMKYLDQVPGQLKQYYDPYVNAGTQSLSDLMGQYQSLINDPGAKMNQMGENFQQSPGYDFQYQNAMNGSNAAAAAGGMAGTPTHQQDAATLATNLANQDYYNWMDRTLGLYNTGMNTANSISQQGLTASDALAQSLATNATNQAGLAYKGVEQGNQAKSDKWNNIIGGATNIVSSFF